MRKDFNILNETNPYIPVVGYNVGGSFGIPRLPKYSGVSLFFLLFEDRTH